MKTFKNLFIKEADNDKVKLISFLDYLKTHTKCNWLYEDGLSINYAKNIYKELNEVACFESPLIDHRKARVWLVLWSKEIKIANIVPTETGSLNYDEYNTIFDRFYSDMLLSAARIVGVDLHTTSSYEDIQNVAGFETYEKLLQWAIVCNPTTGNTHPFDFERWADFLVTAFTTDSKLTTKLLERWLLEVQNWQDDEVLQNVISDFEYGKDLLKYYVTHR